MYIGNDIVSRLSCIKEGEKENIYNFVLFFCTNSYSEITFGFTYMILFVKLSDYQFISNCHLPHITTNFLCLLEHMIYFMKCLCN